MLKSKLSYSNPFRNASVLNERGSSNCTRVTTKIPHSTLVNSGVIGPKFVHDVAASWLLLMLMRAFIWRTCNSFRNAGAKSEGGQFRRLQKTPPPKKKLIG